MRKYLVMAKCDGMEYAKMMTEHEIIDHVDMADCTEEEVQVYDVRFGETPAPLTVWGTWHDFDNPLYIKVTDAAGQVVFDGYGTDH